MNTPKHQVRAVHDAETITVYQAYPPAIADAAMRAGRFVPPFKRERMTWIKPSFCWMMYRCGWATKPGQERVLAVRMSRAGFERALGMASLSHFDRRLHDDAAAWAAQKAASPVRVQWDPERTASGVALEHRSLQVGIGGADSAAEVDCAVSTDRADRPDQKVKQSRNRNDFADDSNDGAKSHSYV